VAVPHRIVVFQARTRRDTQERRSP